MKKTLAVILAVLMIFSLSACSAFSSPEKTIGTFCEAIKSFDEEKMNECVAGSESDAAGIAGDYEEYHDFFKDLASQLTYEITDSETQGDKAEVKVKFTYPDLTQAAVEASGEYMRKLLTELFSNPDFDPSVFGDEMLGLIIEKAENQEAGTAEAEVIFTLSKTDGKWLIETLPEEMDNIVSANITKTLDALAERFN